MRINIINNKDFNTATPLTKLSTYLSHTLLPQNKCYTTRHLFSFYFYYSSSAILTKNARQRLVFVPQTRCLQPDKNKPTTPKKKCDCTPFFSQFFLSRFSQTGYRDLWDIPLSRIHDCPGLDYLIIAIMGELLWDLICIIVEVIVLAVGGCNALWCGCCSNWGNIIVIWKIENLIWELVWLSSD